MKRFVPILWVLFLSIIMCSCTENSRARRYGGTMEIKLEKGEKLVDVTWKENDIWYLTKPMVEGDTAETYYYREESRLNFMEGKVVFIESK